jgi:hypothetical protein
MSKSGILNGALRKILPGTPHTLVPSNKQSTLEASMETKLPRRDWIVLPALSLLTICIIAVCTEAIALRIFPAHGDMKDCLVWNDRSTGVRGIPNCVCQEKIPEGHPVEYRFNSCGDYTGVECGPKPPGTYRIVMTGTSFPVGLGVAREKTFAVLLPKELSRRTGRRVELYNASLPRKSPRIMDLRFNEMLALKPDLILLALNYSDIQLATLAAPSDYVPENVSPPATTNDSVDRRAPLRSALAKLRGEAESAVLVLLHRVNNSWAGSRSYVLLTDFVAATETQSQLLKRNRTSEGQYLSAVPSQARLMHLKEFNGYAEEMEDRARAAGVPVVVVFLPTRIQAAMISGGQWAPDIDPFQFDDQLRSIVQSHSGTYIDILPDLRAIPNAEKGFFPADGHFNEQGHAIISDLLAKELTSGSLPALNSSLNSEHEFEKGK